MIGSKRKPNLIESNRGNDFYNNIFQNFFNNVSFAAVFAERYNGALRDLLKRPDYEKGESNTLDILPIITKQNNDRFHSSTKLTPTQASLKRTKDCLSKHLDQRKKVKPKF